MPRFEDQFQSGVIGARYLRPAAIERTDRGYVARDRHAPILIDTDYEYIDADEARAFAAWLLAAADEADRDPDRGSD